MLKLNYKVQIIGFVLTIVFVAISTSYPLISLICASSFLVLIFWLTTTYNPIPVLSILFLTLIASFNLGRPSYIIVGGLTFIYLMAFVLGYKYREKISATNFQYFFYAWVIYAAAQIVFQTKTNLSWMHFQSLILGVLIIWLMSRFINSKNRLELTYKIWGICLLFTIIVGWWEILTGNHVRSSVAYPNATAATVGFFNQNDYSFFLAISLPVVLYWIKDKFIYRILGLFMLGSIYYLVYVNGSRLVLIILFVGLFIFLLNIIRTRKTGLVFLIISAIFLLILFNLDFLLGTFEKITTLNEDDASVNIRKQLTQAGFNIFKEHPFFGVGPGNIDYYMPQAGDKVHNFWLEVLVNYGVFIFIGLVLFFGWTLYTSIKKVPEEMKSLIWPMLLSIIIFVPASFTSSSIFQFEILWFFLGVMLSINTIIKRMTNLERM